MRRLARPFARGRAASARALRPLDLRVSRDARLVSVAGGMERDIGKLDALRAVPARQPDELEAVAKGRDRLRTGDGVGEQVARRQLSARERCSPWSVATRSACRPARSCSRAWLGDARPGCRSRRSRRRRQRLIARDRAEAQFVGESGSSRRSRGVSGSTNDALRPGGDVSGSLIRAQRVDRDQEDLGRPFYALCRTPSPARRQAARRVSAAYRATTTRPS